MKSVVTDARKFHTNFEARYLELRQPCSCSKTLSVFGRNWIYLFPAIRKTETD